MTPLLFGLGAAVGWGFADYVAALVSRRIGVFRTMFVMQTSSLLLLGAVLAATGHLPPLNPGTVVAALVLGGLGGLMIAALYKALAVGPIAIVSPVVSANAAVTVVLAVIVFSEALSALQVTAIAMTIGGVMLASTDLRLVRETRGKPGPGVALALISMLGFGVMGLLLAHYARELGAVGMTFVLRAGTVALMLLLLGARPRFAAAVPLGLLGLAVLVGILDTLGNVSFGLGAEAGFASIVATGATAYPLIPIALGLGFLRERIAPNQFVGVALLLAGLLTLGLTG